MPVAVDSAAGVAAVFALALVPGLALLRILSPGAPRDAVARAGLAAGLGLAAVPVVVLWLAVVGAPVGPWTWWAVLAAGGAGGAWPRGRGGGGEKGAPSRALSPADAAACAALAVVLAIQLAARWAAARDVVIPVWADSVHHTMIVRLFALQRGLPPDWLPLAPLATFSYHFGFHAVVAAVADLTGLAAPRAVVVVGQALMVVQALTVAGLTALLTGRRWAGVAAAVVVGGLGPMPGAYLTWGRYTQLAGQVVLPSAVGLAVLAAGAPAVDGDTAGAAPRAWRRRAGHVAAAALALAGLALTHYVVTLFYVAALGAWCVVAAAGGAWRARGGVVDAGRPDDRGAREDAERPGDASPRARAAAVRSVGRLAAVGALGVGLALPWLPRFLAGHVDQSAVALATTELPGAVWGAVSLDYVAAHFGSWVGVGLAGATAVAVAAGLAGRDRAVAVAALWIAVLVAASYPRAFGLPITGPLKDFTVLIGLYVPAAVAIGAAVGRGVDAWTRTPATQRGGPGARRLRPAGAVATTLVAAAALGARQRDVIEADRVIATPADARALAWVRERTPPDAVFLASGRPTYGDTVVLGEDGGWWLPVLADRACTIPPLIVGHERTVEADYRPRTVALAQAAAADLTAADTVEQLRRVGVTHAYVGPTATSLSAARLAAAGWRRLYDEAGASVWAAPWTAP